MPECGTAEGGCPTQIWHGSNSGTYLRPVPFEEYDAIRGHFKASGIPSGPTINLSSPDLEEDEVVPQA